MLDLIKAKAVLFDFDDTLCIHTRRPLSMALNVDQYGQEVLGHGNPWPCGIKSENMGDFLSLCVTRGMHTGLISTTAAYPYAEEKVRWVHKNYGVRLNNYCVGENTYKIQMLKHVAQFRDLLPENVLLVDDMWSTLDEASNAGFQACSPMECVTFLEQLRNAMKTMGYSSFKVSDCALYLEQCTIAV